MMSLTIPPAHKKRIEAELASIPVLSSGKHTLTVEFHYGTGGALSSMKIKKYSEDEVR